MKIEIRIDDSCREPKIVVLTDQMTEEIRAIVSRLAEDTPQMIAGFRDGMLEILEQADIIRIYAEAGKIFAVTKNGVYTLRLRLYEMEDRLNKQCFVRISNSEIINLNKVKGFDLSFAGTICVSLSDGSTTYVSRRFVSKIKQVLGI